MAHARICRDASIRTRDAEQGPALANETAQFIDCRREGIREGGLAVAGCPQQFAKDVSQQLRHARKLSESLIKIVLIPDLAP